MLKNPKQKGSHRERKSAKYMENLYKDKKCFHVKAGGSLGEFDFIFGIRGGATIAVQVKSRMFTKKEIQFYKNIKMPVGWLKELHIWKNYDRIPLVIEV